MILSLDFDWVLTNIKSATMGKDISIGAKLGFMIFDLDTAKLQALWKDYGEYKGNLQAYTEKMETILGRKPMILQD